MSSPYSHYAFSCHFYDCLWVFSLSFRSLYPHATHPRLHCGYFGLAFLLHAHILYFSATSMAQCGHFSLSFCYLYPQATHPTLHYGYFRLAFSLYAHYSLQNSSTSASISLRLLLQKSGLVTSIPIVAATSSIELQPVDASILLYLGTKLSPSSL